MLNNHGFTLIETLFVLMIICLLSSLTMTLHIPQKSDEMIVEEISQFFREAQLTAMTYKEKVKVTIHSHELSYTSPSHQQTYSLQDDVSFDNYQFSFNNQGHIQIAKTLTCYIKNQPYYFVFQVGSGYFYVQP